MRRGLRVGVTLPATGADAYALLTSSGVHQNALFLLQLFQRLAEVEFAAVVSGPDGGPSHPVATLGGLVHLSLAQAVERLDVLVELGWRADAATMARFRGGGGRLVSYMAGNVMAMNLEAVANGSAHGDLLTAAGFDAVWMTPQHAAMNLSYARLLLSSEVRIAPHVWSPGVLLGSAAQAGASPFWRPPADRWRLGVFEPNVNALKTFHLPLLVCEEAYRRSADRIGRVLLFNTAPLAGTAHFQEFCSATDLARDGRLGAEGRAPLAQVLGRHVDAVVTHQWQNALNYLYWEALYLGFPLVHNSGELGEAGYRYGDFDPQDGGAVLSAALEQHAGARRHARAAELEAVWRHCIDNPCVQQAYSDLLAEVVA